MRLLHLLAATALVATGAPALGQATSDFEQAISNTIAASAMRRGFTSAQAAATVAAASGKVSRFGAVQSWLDWSKKYVDLSVGGWVWPFNLLYSNTTEDCSGVGETYCVGFDGGGVGFTGGGASGSWERDCEDFIFRLDVAGNLVVPTVPLTPSGPIPLRTWGSGQPITAVYTPCAGQTAPTNCGGGYFASAIGAPTGSALWALHKSNEAKGSDERGWQGAWRVTLNYNNSGYPRVYVRGQSFYDTSAVLRNAGANTVSVLAVSNNNYGAPYSKACPEGTVIGGDFHYYHYSPQISSSTQPSWLTCTAYAPDGSISPSGYYYPATVSIPFGDVDTYVSSWNAMAECPVSPEFIKKVADALWQDAADDPGYTGVPWVPVTNEDIKTGGEDPHLDDLIPDPGPLPPPSTNNPPPTATPDPEPGGTGTPPPDYSFPTTPRGEPVAEEIDWWPDLPTIEVDLGTPACPAYTLDLPQWDAPFVLDSHCPLIEDNRAIISALMLAMFTMMSVFIVLRA